jgi:hypothetical protein
MSIRVDHQRQWDTICGLRRDAVAAATEIFASFKIELEDREAATLSICEEFERRAPEFVRLSTICVMLPTIEVRLSKYYRRWSELTKEEADELAAVVALKIYECLCGRWPYGNVGAWAFSIAKNEGLRHLRRRSSLTRIIGSRVAHKDLDSEPGHTSTHDRLQQLLIDLPPEVRMAYEQGESGNDWTAIEADLHITRPEMYELLQDIDRPPGGSSPRRKNLRRRR